MLRRLKNLFRLLPLLLLCPCLLNAAGPIVHAYLTERFFEHYPKYDQQEKRIFMLGTLFPDIQYLGEASREETHEEEIALLDVLREPSPFVAGMKFHCYVDRVREEFVRRQKIYEDLGNADPEQQHIIFLKLKLMEDEVVFDCYNWQEWRDVLQEVHSEELNWGMGLTTVRKWHNLLNICLTNPPSTIIFLLSITNASFLNIPSSAISEWNRVLKSTAHSANIKKFVQEMLRHFEAEMEEMPYSSKLSY
jgi:hypothetical protein